MRFCLLTAICYAVRMTEYDALPLTLTRAQAAKLCGLSPPGFDAWVRKGIVPPPIPGTHRWSKEALRAALAGKPDAVVVELDPFEQWLRDNPDKGLRNRK